MCQPRSSDAFILLWKSGNGYIYDSENIMKKRIDRKFIMKQWNCGSKFFILTKYRRTQADQDMTCKARQWTQNLGKRGKKMSDHFNLMIYFTTNSKHCVDITYATSENKKARMTKLKNNFSEICADNFLSVPPQKRRT